MNKYITVIVPAYNEASTIRQVLDVVFSVAPLKEVIVVNDGSTDGTGDILSSIEADVSRNPPKMLKGLKIINKENGGKGSCIRAAASLATGEIVIIQDADLETDPHEYVNILAPFTEYGAHVVFGSRFRREGVMRVHKTYHILGNKFLTWISNFCSGLYVTDMETCYKAFRREILQSFKLRSNGFGIEPELTAKTAELVFREKLNFYEVPISYRPRTHAEGKKIKLKDGLTAIVAIIYFNLISSR